MKTIDILVEGQTEEKFVKELLKYILKPKGVDLNAIIIKTKIVKGGSDFVGGISEYSQIERDLRNILESTDADLVTTMIDFYKFPGDMPGLENAPVGDYIKRIDYYENTFAANINDNRFLPYLQLHEFEALLFSSPEAIDNTLYKKRKLPELRGIVAQFNSPEEINEGENTAPSKRLKNLYGKRGYSKTIHGPLIAGHIGLDLIREKCPHFDQWLTKVERL